MGTNGRSGARGASEKEIQNAILRELSTRRDLRVWRQNVGVAVPLTAAVKRALAHTDYRVVHFSIPGAADLTGILGNGKRLEIECTVKL